MLLFFRDSPYSGDITYSRSRVFALSKDIKVEGNDVLIPSYDVLFVVFFCFVFFLKVFKFPFFFFFFFKVFQLVFHYIFYIFKFLNVLFFSFSFFHFFFKLFKFAVFFLLFFFFFFFWWWYFFKFFNLLFFVFVVVFNHTSRDLVAISEDGTLFDPNDQTCICSC